MGGLVQIVPVQETVMMLNSPLTAPQLTITAGSGYIMVPGFHISLLIFRWFKTLDKKTKEKTNNKVN